MSLKSKPKADYIERKDGRVELRGRLYQRMRSVLCRMAQGCCEQCKRNTNMDHGEVHHLNGRGGGRRDDRIFVPDANGVYHRNLEWRCKDCHGKAHVPEKVVPAKMSDDEFRKLLGVAE